MADAVLPTGIGRAVKGVVVADPLVNLGKCESFLGRSEDGHSNQLGVAVRRLVAVVDDGREGVGRRNDYGGWLSLDLL